MALITLKQYAEQHGKNQRACRKKAVDGKFQTTVKAGRDWMIDSDEPYVDNRIKHGKYIEQRKKKESKHG